MDDYADFADCASFRSDEQTFIKRFTHARIGGAPRGVVGRPQVAGFFFAFNRLPAALSSKRPRADMRGGQPVGFKLGYRAEDGSLYRWLGGVLPAHHKTGLARPSPCNR